MFTNLANELGHHLVTACKPTKKRTNYYGVKNAKCFMAPTNAGTCRLQLFKTMFAIKTLFEANCLGSFLFV